MRQAPFSILSFLMPVVCLLGASSCTSSPRNVPEQKNASTAPTVEDGFRHYTLREGGGVIQLRIAEGPASVSDPQIIKWVQTAAAAVSHYFGHYPLREVTITIQWRGNRTIQDGVTNDQGIRVSIGRRTRPKDLEDEWVMTHEMFHLAFPYIDDQYIWLREGLASYLEPLARARMGTIPAKQVWGQFLLGMRQGQPEPGDQGLDVTHTWGRTYWGGSMFCLLADLQIREKTHNAKSLDDAMRAILEHGGNVRAEWSLEKVIDIGDRATGTHVLRDLHTEMGHHPVTVDLPALWDRLGVSYHDEQVFFNDSAPLATIRQSMTSPKP
jgi:hypothetical protein